MKRRIIWSAEAIGDLTSLRADTEYEVPAAARRDALHVLKVIDTYLAGGLEIGRPGRRPGSRRVVVADTPYVVDYRVRDDVVQIARIRLRSQMTIRICRNGDT